MALHLVTGYAGKTHITAADHGAMNAGVFGNKDYVVNTGNNFAAVPITANTIKILDGEVILHGRHIRMEAGDYEEVTIENGTADQKRNDLICIRYVKDSETGIESASCVVVKGTPDSSSPIDPAYNEGSILEGTLTVDFPLYRVPLDGLNVGELVPLFKVHDSLADRMAEAEENAAGLKTDIANIENGTTPVGDSKLLEGLTAEEVGASGARNLIPYPYYNSDKTANGISWAVDSSGAISANGTATASTSFWIIGSTVDTVLKLDAAKTYTVSMPNNLNSNYILSIRLYKEGDTISSSGGTLKTLSTNNHSHTFTGYDYISLYIYVYSGTTLDNLAFKPMLEIGSVAHDYVPYHLGGAKDALKLQGMDIPEFVANENLLINADFKNPVNSSGLTEWTTNGTTVDAWKKASAEGVMQLTENGIKSVNNSSTLGLQWLASSYTYNILPTDENKKVTLSAKLRKSKTGFNVRVTAYGTRKDTWIADTTDWQVVTATFEVTSAITAISITTDSGLTGGEWVEIEWVKLELGSVATPFVPPNPEIEAVKCGVADADTLDGYHASDMVQMVDLGYTETDTKTAIGTSKKTTIYRGNRWTDIPSSFPDSQATLIAINYSGNGTAGSEKMWVRQFIFSPLLRKHYERWISDTTVRDWESVDDKFFPLTGGTVQNTFKVETTKNDVVTTVNYAPLSATLGGQNMASILLSRDSVEKAKFGFNETGAVLADLVNSKTYNVLHTGNSNAVIFTESSTTAPSDTTALWAHLD